MSITTKKEEMFNNEQRNVVKIIEEVIKEICDNCKYTKTYRDNSEMLIDDKCRNCPLNGL